MPEEVVLKKSLAGAGAALVSFHPETAAVRAEPDYVSAKTQENSDDDMFGEENTKPTEIDDMFKDVD